MTTKEFIEKAIEGGWRIEGYGKNWKYDISEYGALSAYENSRSIYSNKYFKEKILLDPLSWAAVGKTEGWGLRTTEDERDPVYDERMLGMVKARIAGKSIEEYLTTL